MTNEDICGGLGVSAAWIRSRTGIASRARAAHGVSTADLAVQAGARALRTGDGGRVDALVLATITPDHRCPATAPGVAARLGLPGIPAFDLAAACTGLLYALQVAAGFIAARTARRVLIIAADRIPSLVNPQDRATAPLFGEGAAALVVRAGERGAPGALGPIMLAADGRDGSAIVAPHGGFLTMRGPETFQQAVTRMSEASVSAAEAAGWRLADVDRFVPHQANARITAAVVRQLELEDSQALQFIEQVGNTSAASIPLTLAQASADGRLLPGHRVLMTAFGAGLTWGAATVVWPALSPSDLKEAVQ
ncbi:3-oxoacyl-[acyl-carrier-protein] synthase-3 [Actinomadura catellatispora]|uniref:3-oxoacyl-[acyl-carrier-protein] synthase-3 n=1 Tax=Actinomadura livida TaxID=79909 RepID=A0A7W7I7L1_9ACTN|nr:3-oxoacyl-[acyl-carrier-protein] synthase-3 [Actinomadura catellatispora]